MSIVILFFPVDYGDNQARANAQAEAIKDLSLAPQPFIPLALGFYGQTPHPLVKELDLDSLNIIKGDSLSGLGSERRLPYIKEILDVGAKMGCKKFGYINSDIFLSEFAYNALLQEDKDAYIFSRVDIEEITAERFLNLEFKVVENKHPGADGFFFNREWWKKKHYSFPQKLVCAATEWDSCYRHIIKQVSSNYYEGRNLYHVSHAPSWNTTSPEAINNIKLWERVKASFKG